MLDWITISRLSCLLVWLMFEDFSPEYVGFLSWTSCSQNGLLIEAIIKTAKPTDQGHPEALTISWSLTKEQQANYHLSANVNDTVGGWEEVRIIYLPKTPTPVDIHHGDIGPLVLVYLGTGQGSNCHLWCEHYHHHRWLRLLVSLV